MKVRTGRELGALVRDRREYMGLTQQELAKRASVTREWLLRFEHGKSTVPLSKVLDVLTALHLVIDVEDDDAR
ncbi:helix-turn-helix domain-containing protein [Salinibacterium sp. SYSU T00001]|uniref:helix-turn-helix domain-containing protein n=1 Tax=Homoserinimonas sedimenticola TaxID=2986805 RepID=UPI0022357EEC|nr:helix-turn-helix transcriptional regulator [Salinibacterium sedimenticola]MCW4385466.1 helix-turn-helix domain-containing protein [Salinibacterium sedimenticola]